MTKRPKLSRNIPFNNSNMITFFSVKTTRVLQKSEGSGVQNYVLNLCKAIANPTADHTHTGPTIFQTKRAKHPIGPPLASITCTIPRCEIGPANMRLRPYVYFLLQLLLQKIQAYVLGKIFLHSQKS